MEAGRCPSDSSASTSQDGPSEPQSAALLPELLPCVLARVPQAQRLRTCALVSKQWRAAAAAVTTSMRLCCLEPDKAGAACSWMRQHGGVRSLRVTPPPEQELQLPVSSLAGSLRELDCEGCTIVSAEGLGLGELRALERCELQGCRVHTQGGLAALSRLRCLRVLRIDWTSVREEPMQPGGLDPVVRDIACVLRAPAVAGSLTSLGLSLFSGEDPGDLPFAGLSSLQALQLSASGFSTGALVDLPSRLTRLELTEAVGIALCAARLPCITRLQRLVELNLWCLGELEPQLLPRWPALRRLTLGADGGCRGEWPPRGSLGTAAADALLAALARCSGLQRLELVDALGAPASLATAHTALVAPRGLTALVLRNCQLPRAAALHIFAPGLRLPLREFECTHALAADAADNTEREQAAFGAPGCVPALVAACPGLQALRLRSCLSSRGAAGLSALSCLSALTALHVVSQCLTDAVAAALARLPRLRRLHADSRLRLGALSLAGVAAWTALRRLTWLRCICSGDGELVLRCGEGQPPVWLQLAEYLEARPDERLATRLRGLSLLREAEEGGASDEEEPGAASA